MNPTGYWAALCVIWRAAECEQSPASRCDVYDYAE